MKFLRISILMVLVFSGINVGWSQAWRVFLSAKLANNAKEKKIFLYDSSQNLILTRDQNGRFDNQPFSVGIANPYQPNSMLYLLQHDPHSLEYQLNVYYNLPHTTLLQDVSENELVVETEDLIETVLEIDSVYAVDDFLYNVTTAGNNERYRLKRNKLQIYFQRNTKLDYCFFFRINHQNRYQFYYLPASAPKAKKIKTSIRALSGYLESCTVYHYDSSIRLGQLRSTNEETGRECFFYDVPALQNDSSVTFFIPRGFRWKNNYLQLENNQDEFKDAGGTSFSYFKVLTDWKDFIPSYWFLHRKPSAGWTRETLSENGYTREVDLSQHGYYVQTSLTGITIAYLNTQMVFNQQGQSNKKLGNLEREPLPIQIIRYLVEESRVRMYSNESLLFSQDYGTLSTAFLTSEGYQLFQQMPNLVFSRRNQPNLRMYLQTVIEPVSLLKEFIYVAK